MALDRALLTKRMRRIACRREVTGGPNRRAEGSGPADRFCGHRTDASVQLGTEGSVRYWFMASLYQARRKIQTSLYLRRCGVQCGPRAISVGRMLIVQNEGKITIGNDFWATGWRSPPQIIVRPNATLQIGDHSSMNAGTLIEAASEIVIGDNVAIADYVAISDTGNHQLEQGAEVRIAPVRIGSNVWIGRHAMVMPGLSIGDHAVVAAGAVVTRDVPAQCLVSGIPAKVQRANLCAEPGWWRK